VNCLKTTETTTPIVTDYDEQFYQGEVVEIMEESESEGWEGTTNHQTLQVEIENGELKGEILTLEYESTANSQKSLEVGDRVVIVEHAGAEQKEYTIFEAYRVPSLAWLFMIFVGLTALISGKKGLSSLLGLAFTFLVLIEGAVPLIIKGWDPLGVSFGAALLIMVISISLAHGFHKRTFLAIVSTAITLHLALALGWMAVSFSKLFGLGSEDAVFLSFGEFSNIDLKGLLLGAIVIGSLGVLDDITTAQTATIEEIHKANTKLHFKDLYQRGLSVGKEHIASLVNTLILAYVGASFPILILLVSSTTPLWVTLNNEFMAEEIVRTLIGSITLITAVPISTVLAAWMYGRK
ncbi:MAG: hypothetical protein UW70_C0022G0025, partial [Candidatus Peregrinibacteria bacterium GW2011_GWA2_44_7]